MHVVPHVSCLCQANFPFHICFCVVSDASSTKRKALQLAATLILLSAVGAADCPEECVCMWKNGKETTECINRDKDSIPQGIEPSTQASLTALNPNIEHKNKINSFIFYFLFSNWTKKCFSWIKLILLL